MQFLRKYQSVQIVLLGLLLTFFSPYILAQISDMRNFPTKAVKIIVPFSPGGVADITARVIGQKLSESWGQPVIIDNRPGAGGIIGSDIVSKSNPDGYTLLSASANHSAISAVKIKLPYDVVKDFSGISLTSSGAYVLVVPLSANIRSIKDLIQKAKNSSEKINFASAGTGSGTHFAAELFTQKANIQAVHIPYKGIPEALTDLISGRVDFFMPSLSSVISFIKEGKVVALAVSGKNRALSHPDLPTIAESEILNYEWNAWTAILAPSGTPRSIINKIHGDINTVLMNPEIKKRMLDLGADVLPISPNSLDEMIAKEVLVTNELAKKSGIKPE